MDDSWIVYGTGSFARSLLSRAEGRGVRFAIAGRDRNAVDTVARVFQLPQVRLATSERGHGQELPQYRGVLNVAGPFESTVPGVLANALRARLSYVDISNEWCTHALAQTVSEEAARKGVAIVPGAGLGTYAIETLSNHLLLRMPSASRLAIIRTGRAQKRTPGRQESVRRILAERPLQRIDGELVPVSDRRMVQASPTTVEKRTLLPIADGGLAALISVIDVANVAMYGTTDVPASIARHTIPLARLAARRFSILSRRGQGVSRERSAAPVAVGYASNEGDAVSSAFAVDDTETFAVETAFAVLRKIGTGTWKGTHTAGTILGLPNPGHLLSARVTDLA